MKTLRKEILQFMRNNQGKEFSIETIRDEMWKIFASESMNAYAYFVQTFEHEVIDLVKKKKIKKIGDSFTLFS
jgi:hypothetical protein